MNIKKLLLLATVALSLNANAIEQDKKLHFAGSALIAGGVQAYSQDWRVAMGSCMAVGLAKEIYDEYDYGGFDGKDLAYDLAGCVTGTLLMDTGLKIIAGDSYTGIEYSIKF